MLMSTLLSYTVFLAKNTLEKNIDTFPKIQGKCGIREMEGGGVLKRENFTQLEMDMKTNFNLLYYCKFVNEMYNVHKRFFFLRTH